MLSFSLSSVCLIDVSLTVDYGVRVRVRVEIIFMIFFYVYHACFYVELEQKPLLGLGLTAFMISDF